MPPNGWPDSNASPSRRAVRDEIAALHTRSVAPSIRYEPDAAEGPSNRTSPALGRVGADPHCCRGRGRSAAPSRSPPSPHSTQNESPARPAVVLFWGNPKNFKSKSGRQIGRKNGLVRRNRVQGIAKLDHPVSRESAAKNSGDRGLCKLGCTQTIKYRVPGRSGIGDDRASQALRAPMRNSSVKRSRSCNHSAEANDKSRTPGSDKKPSRCPGKAGEGITPGDNGVGRDMSASRRNPGDGNGPPGSAACAGFRLGSPRLHEPEDHADVADSLIGQRRR